MTVVTRETAARIRDYLHRRRDRMVGLLEQLVLAESPSNVPSAQTAVLDLLEDALRQCGFRTRRVPGRQTGGHLLALPPARIKPAAMQLLLGHCDTVWPLGTLESMPLRRQGDKLYGPGVYDMKAGLVQAVYALEALEALAISPVVAPMVFVNSDEEIGSRESTRHIRRLAGLSDRVFVLEPSLGPSGKLKTRRKGVARFTVRVSGKAAHAGLAPEQGASAILELAIVIQKIFALNDESRGITVNVGTIDGGLRPNVVAPESRAEVDVRVLSREDLAYVDAAIRGLQPTTPGTRIAVEGRVGRPPLEDTPGNRLLMARAREAASELGLDLDDGTAGGGSDGNTTSLFAPTLDGLGAVGDQAHAPGEFVFLDAMVERGALLARLLLGPPLGH